MNDINTEEFETGTLPAEVILPDRLTHITHKGADHPTPFAKGCRDDVPPGTSTQSPFSGNSVDDQTDLVHGRNTVTSYGNRVFADDSALAFEPREEFAGRRGGFVFRLGSQGLGYYEDRPSRLPSASER